MLIVLALGAGAGLGWVACWFFVARPLVATVRDMRYQGFVRDAPVPRKLPTGPQFERNET